MRYSCVSLYASLFLLLATPSFAQVTPSRMTSTTQPSSEIQTLKPLERPLDRSQQPRTTTSSRPSLAPIPPIPKISQRASYLHPGILVYLNGQWEGSDHLLNVSPHIGVYVTLVKPAEEDVGITQEQLQKQVENSFGQADITPSSLVPTGRPPLPAFEIEIFIYPIERGYAACCDGRLFESVILERFKMDPNMAFQAITWEKQNLIVGPKTTFGDQLSQTVQEIVDAFIERFQAYENVRKRSLR